MSLSNRMCVDIDCLSKYYDPGIKFYNVGSARKRVSAECFQRWQTALRRDKNLRDTDDVCSLHFDENDYEDGEILRRQLMPNTFKVAPKLKIDAYPHLNLTTDKPKHQRIKPVPLELVETVFLPPDEKHNFIGESDDTFIKNETNPIDTTWTEQLHGYYSENCKEELNAEESQSSYPNDTDNCAVTDEKNPLFRVTLSSLDTLFKFCQVCGSKVKSVVKRKVGALVIVNTECEAGHKNVWRSRTVHNKR